MSISDVTTEKREVRTEQQESVRPVPPKKGRPLPPLQSGDRLTRYEFERRYEAMSKPKKVELVEGVVYVSSPITVFHSEPHGQIVVWLGTYQALTPGVRFNDNSTVRLDVDNEVQPDALLRVEAELGGNSRVTNEGYIEGPPELIAEIAYSSAAYDLHDKLKVYRRSGVREYIIWQVDDNRLDWFWLNEKGEYELLAADETGLIRSRVFPGLNLQVAALLDGKLAVALAALQEGLGQDEHQAFVKKLKEG